MSKLEERENRRRAIIGGMIDNKTDNKTDSKIDGNDSMIGEAEPPAVGAPRRGRPKTDRELKKRISLSVLPSLYADIRKIAYVQRRSASELVALIMEEYRSCHEEELAEYQKLQK